MISHFFTRPVIYALRAEALRALKYTLRVYRNLCPSGGSAPRFKVYHRMLENTICQMISPDITVPFRTGYSFSELPPSPVCQSLPSHTAGTLRPS